MNFEILKINGEEASNLDAQVLIDLIQSISEPISLVLRRSHGQNKSNTQVFISPSTPHNGISTQTDPSHYPRCFCGRLNSKADEKRVKQHRFNLSSSDHVHDPSQLSSNDRSDQASRLESNLHGPMSFEEVILPRPKKGQKLGITLCDDIDPLTKEPRVTVASVAFGSEASKSEKVRAGDVIAQIDNVSVRSMEEAAKILEEKLTSYTFLIGRLQARSPIAFESDDHSNMHHYQQLDNRDVCRDVMHSITANKLSIPIPVRSISMTSQGRDIRNDSTGSKSPARSPTNEKHPKSIQRIMKYHRSQSLIGNILLPNQEPTKQNPFQALPRRSSYGDCLAIKNKNTSRPPIANDDFVYVQPKKSSFAKRVSFSKESPLARQGVPQMLTNGSLLGPKNALRNGSNELSNEDRQQPRKALLSSSTVGELEDLLAGGLSPWVQIARRDYENKIQQLQNDAQTNKSTNAPKKPISTSPASPSVPTDNTSSAYSTGESFRSSSSNNETCVGGGLNTPVRPQSNPFPDPEPETSSCYTSSDANSDGDDPACYLTHVEDENESDGFEDARIEFRSLFSSKNFTSKPTLFPRLLHPPQESKEDFKFHPCLSSGDSETNAAARNDDNSKNLSANKSQRTTEIIESSNNSEQKEPKTHNFSIPAITISDEDSGEAQTSRLSENAISDHRVKSEMDRNLLRQKSELALPARRPLAALRSISCVESRELHQSDADGSISMEWKVRIRKDGTRYITKRPVRRKACRSRDRRMNDERSAPSSDEDQTEAKIGRRWSRDDRKRHSRVAREKKRRRDYMQRRRLEALNENSQTTEQIVELSHIKMSKHKQKRMLFDNFVTVQELLAHGNRTGDVTSSNPLLSVSYI